MTAYIYDALRTPRGKANAKGGLAQLSPQELVKQLAGALVQRVPGATDNPEALLLGCVGQVGAQGGNIALVAKFHAELPDSASAYTINNYCVSGLTAIGQAANIVNSGSEKGVLAGGVEAMSQVGFMSDRANYYGDMSFPERTRYIPVALAADRLAASENISRQQMDDAAFASQQRAAIAQNSDVFQRSRIVMKMPDGSIALAQDECVRPQTNMEGLAALPHAFGGLAAEYADTLGNSTFPPSHSVSHAPPICDGAGLALIGDEHAFDQKPRAKILAYAECGGDPAQSLTAGFAAMEKALMRAGLDLSQMDRIEFMEAFGVTITKFLRDYPVDAKRVNASGGHLAKGHPLGASGAILASTLLDCLDEANGTLGMVVSSGASGIGAAMIVERLT